ncbi:MAG: isoprenyl transferase [Candidatus Omnitrophica bacterium]|nr:isoprenyl transferase [Candidatus Omnitrophota bacterium]
MEKKVPRHIAIIMDGNGRWAQQRGLPKLEGHRAGANSVEEAITGCIELGVGVLTLYAFSTENWRRSKQEVSALMSLLGHYIKKELARLDKNKIRFMVSGAWEDLAPALRKQIQGAIDQTKDNSKLIFNLALNYGGREDILQAVRKIALEVKEGKLKADQINHELFASHLYTANLPEPDLLIRTSGEQRISNFLLWQISYAELIFTTKFWPDFKKQDLVQAVLEYQQRERRFGS